MDIRLKDLEFEPFIPADEIADKIQALAARLDADYAGSEIRALCIMNGSFIFAADLLRQVAAPAELSFLSVSSYAGTESTGRVSIANPPGEELAGKHVLIIEDIVDTGLTLDALRIELQKLKPASLRCVTLLFKPENFEGDNRPEYTGFEIPPAFVVGYGMDYDQLGRNLSDIYRLKT